MPDLYNQPETDRTTLMDVLPALVIPVGIVLVAIPVLVARQPETRRHCLEVFTQLIRYASQAKP